MSVLYYKIFYKFINQSPLKGYESKSFHSSPFFSHLNHNLQSNVEYKFIDRSDYDLIAWRKKKFTDRP